MDESPRKEPDINIDLVKEWVREAGQIALGYFNRVEGTRKPDRTLVSDADYAIEELLTGYVRTTYPSHGIVGEEGTNEIHGEYTWAIDPLDGTRAFLSGLPVWGISIGLLWKGRPWAGVFHLPLLDDWYHSAHPAKGAFWNDQPIHCPPPDGWDEDSLLLIPADAHLQYDISFPGIMRAMGSAAAHLCYAARGSALAVFLANPGIWDVAAGAAILRAAGGGIRYLAGPEVLAGEQLGESPHLDPLLAGHPTTIDRLRPHIKPRVSS